MLVAVLMPAALAVPETQQLIAEFPPVPVRSPRHGDTPPDTRSFDLLGPFNPVSVQTGGAPR